MKLIDNKLIAEEGYLLKDINDNGEKLEDGTFIEPYKTKDPWLLPESIEEASKSPLLQAPKKKNVSKATAKKRISSKENSIRKQQKTKSGKYGQ